MELRRDIVLYEGLYQISNLGRVKSLKNGKRGVGKERILKPGKCKGYYNINLCNTIRKSARIHRLVAEAFIPNPDNKSEVNHKDGNRLNNNVRNLEWVTGKENIAHCFNVLGYKGSAYGKFGKDNPHSKIVLQYTLDGVFIKERGSQQEIKRILKINQTTISLCCNGKRKTTGGYIWKFKS